MSIRVKDVIPIIEELAPRHLAESWDNVGLMCGHPEDSVSTVWLALTPTMDVLERAQAHGASLVVTHHPLIFKGIKSLREDDSPAKELSFLIRNKMALYCAHTNLDIAPGGVNDVLAERLGLSQTTVLSTTSTLQQYSISVYVPTSHLVALQDAVFSAGAGVQGAYSRCSWHVNGIGGFCPGDAANPFIGRASEYEQVQEARLTFVADARVLHRVLKAIKDVHPYEEPVMDVFKNEINGFDLGLGRIGNLPKEMPLESLLTHVGTALKNDHLRYTGDLKKTMRKVAVLGGSGSGFIDEAKSKGADCYITGDLTYHHFQRAKEIDLALIDAGHFATEQPVLYGFREILLDAFDKDVPVTVDENEKNLFFKFN